MGSGLLGIFYITLIVSSYFPKLTSGDKCINSDGHMLQRFRNSVGFSSAYVLDQAYAHSRAVQDSPELQVALSPR